MANEFKVKNGLISPNAILQGSTSGTTTLQASAAASGTITLPAATGTVALTDNNLSVFAATTSSELAGVISDETGSGNLVFSASPTFTGTINADNLTLTGDLSVNGTTTTINSTNLVVEDKSVVLGDVATPTDTTADGGGIILKGATDKTLNWVDATDAWTSSEHLNLASSKAYYINGTSVLNSTTLGSGVTGSSLTSVGTIGTGTWQGTAIASTYGGTGVNNGGRTITLNTGNLTLTAQSGGSSVTVPSTGTLSTLAGTETLTNKSLSDSTTYFIDETDNTKKMQFQLSGVTTATTRTLTVPNFDGTIATLAGTETLSNKTLTTPKINDTSSDHTYNFAASELAANRTITLPLLTNNDTFVFEAHTQTLTNKTLTSPTVSGLYLSDSSIQFEGSSADAFETTLTVTNPTADRTITLPDATGQVVLRDTTDTLTNKTLTSPDINGGTVDSLTGFSLRDTSAAFDVTVTSASSTALTAARTLTVDIINANRSIKLAGNIDIAGNLTSSGGHSITFNTTGLTSITLPTSGTILTENSLSTPTLTTPKINDTSSDHTYNFAVSELTANRTITLPLLTNNDTFVFEAHTQTLTNKTLTSPTINGGTHTAITSLGIRSTGTGAFDLTLANTENLTAARTLTLKLNDADRTVDIAGNLTLANNFTTSGNAALTLTLSSATATNATFPTTGNITLAYQGGTLAQFAATTSAQLAGVISDETGSGALVFGTSPTFTTSIDSGATFEAFASSTDLTIGYNSTAASTTNISTGAVAASTTKTINIGTGGAASSTTNINLGSANGGTVTVNKDLVVSGDLTVNGTTTTINSTTIAVDDKNIILGDVATPTDTTADGGGITLKGATDKTLNWVDSTDAWTSSEHIRLAAGKNFVLAGSTSGTVTLATPAAAGTTTITFPATTGNVVTTGDSSTVTNTMLAGSIANAKLTNSTISGVALGSNLNTLTLGSYLTGTGYNGSSAVTAAVDATSANTASKIVARDGSGNFAANIVTLGVDAALTAAGSTQGTGTALTKAINNVTTVAASTGVVLPTAVAGYVIIVRNGGANALNVYPATGAAINAGAANAAHSLPVGAMIQYVAMSTTQWYTMSSTFA
jgi:hypothetical protein